MTINPINMHLSLKIILWANSFYRALKIKSSFVKGRKAANHKMQGLYHNLYNMNAPRKRKRERKKQDCTLWPWQ